MKTRIYRTRTDHNAASRYLLQAEALLGIDYPRTRYMQGVVRIERAGRVLYVTEPSLWRTRSLYDISSSQTQRGYHD